MTDDLVIRLREYCDCTDCGKCFGCETADEIELLREWKELAYEMRNRSWWAMRKKVLVKFDDMHKSDWKRHE